MPIITDIKAQKKRQDWLSIFVDGKFLFSLPLEVIVRENLKTGFCVTSEKLHALFEESSFVYLYNKTLNFLSFRSRSTAEVKQYLQKNEASETEIDKIIEKLVNLGFLDDKKFARWLIEQRSGEKSRGRRFLLMELRQKGIDIEITDEVLSELRPTETDMELALKLVEKKLKDSQNLDEYKLKNKLTAWLLRRGFSYEVAGEAVEKVLKKK